MNNLYLLIGLIGLSTLLIRASFLYIVPQFIRHPRVRKGMEAVPASMLVALVIPFTFFVNQELVLWRPEVIAILVTVAVVQLTKKYAYGLLVAIASYLLLNTLW